MTIVGYIVTVGLATFGIVSFLAPLLAGLFVRIAGDLGLMSGLLAGGFLGWSMLNWIWLVVEGGPIPLAALGLSFAAVGFQQTAGENLNPVAKQTVAAEMWAIVLLSVALTLMPGPVRWF